MANQRIMHNPRISNNPCRLRRMLVTNLGRCFLPAVVAFTVSAQPLRFVEHAGEAGPSSFSPTGTLATARSGHTATLLQNGKVLIAGGSSYFYDSTLASAELYDPATGTFSTTGSLAAARENHTATLLQSGKVLIAGGYKGGDPLASAELYDPATGTFSPTGSLGFAREYHTATVLQNGKVLIAGGYSRTNGYLTAAELYDPSVGTFSASLSATGYLFFPRASHTATLLQNGKVLVTGGETTSSLGTAELYDPAARLFSVTGNLSPPRDHHTATLLQNGKVLITGGCYGGIAGIRLASVEMYDPAAGTFSPTGSLATARCAHTATLLQNGKVLIIGGSVETEDFKTLSLASAELYDPAAGTFSATGSLTAARDSHTATLLQNGMVLIAGGNSGGYDGPHLTSVELYEPLNGGRRRAVSH